MLKSRGSGITQRIEPSTQRNRLHGQCCPVGTAGWRLPLFQLELCELGKCGVHLVCGDDRTPGKLLDLLTLLDSRILLEVKPKGVRAGSWIGHQRDTQSVPLNLLDCCWLRRYERRVRSGTSRGGYVDKFGKSGCRGGDNCVVHIQENRLMAQAEFMKELPHA